MTAEQENREKGKGKGKEPGAPDCRNCPIARALGMCDGMRSLLGEVDCSDFLAHFSNARREFLLGIKSLLEEVIELEEDKAEKHKQASSTKKRKRRPPEEKLTRIDIE
jgi:hypothetical protein